jgi:hypothetical protein
MFIENVYAFVDYILTISFCFFFLGFPKLLIVIKINSLPKLQLVVDVAFTTYPPPLASLTFITTPHSFVGFIRPFIRTY